MRISDWSSDVCSSDLKIEFSSCTIRRTELSNSIMNDAVAATAFRRLIKHLQHRTDVQNVDLMGLAGFCRNCLADWIAEADGTLSREKAREIVYGMSYDEWKSAHQDRKSTRLNSSH